MIYEELLSIFLLSCNLNKTRYFLQQYIFQSLKLLKNIDFSRTLSKSPYNVQWDTSILSILIHKTWLLLPNELVNVPWCQKMMEGKTSPTDTRW